MINIIYATKLFLFRKVHISVTFFGKHNQSINKVFTRFKWLMNS